MARIIKKKRPKRTLIFRKKVCGFCTSKSNSADYKDIALLGKYTTERGKMIPRRVSGACAKHQRIVAAAIKKARYIALLPYVRK